MLENKRFELEFAHCRMDALPYGELFKAAGAVCENDSIHDHSSGSESTKPSQQ